MNVMSLLQLWHSLPMPIALLTSTVLCWQQKFTNWRRGSHSPLGWRLEILTLIALYS
jgi:hypothetical protein